MEVALQINGRQQQQIGKYQISRSGLVLGRGWDCDVIITDSRADAQHARLHLTDDGLLALEDLDSINGTRSAGHQINNGIVASGDIITIGRTKVQIFSADHPVVPARSPSFYDTAKDVLGTPKWAVISTLAALAIILWFNSLERIREIKPEVMFGEVLGIAVSAVAFALFWSAVGKLLRGESQLLANWSITALWVAVGAVSGDLSQWISFNAQSLTVQIWVEALIQFSILFAILLMMFINQYESRTPHTVLVGFHTTSRHACHWYHFARAKRRQTREPTTQHDHQPPPELNDR